MVDGTPPPTRRCADSTSARSRRRLALGGLAARARRRWRWLRADYLLARNRRAEAASLYRSLLQSNPVYVPGLIVVLADCHERHAVDDAIAVATSALTVDGNHFMALRTLGWAYATLGDDAAARPVIARALAQFDVQKLAEPSRAMRAIDRVVPRQPGVESVADSLSGWKDWAQAYLGSSR